MPTAADVMTPHPVTCTPDATLQDAARMMRDGNFGVLPVVESRQAPRIVGILTDRDIVVRCIAEGGDPRQARVGNHMTHRVDSVRPEAPLDEVIRLMESRHIRRTLVMDAAHALVGIVSLADVAREVSTEAAGAALVEVSERDARQLYSEVLEEGRASGTVRLVEDPSASHHIKQPNERAA